MTNSRNFPIDYRHLGMDVTPRILVSLSYGDETQEDAPQPTHARESLWFARQYAASCSHALQRAILFARVIQPQNRLFRLLDPDDAFSGVDSSIGVGCFDLDQMGSGLEGGGEAFLPEMV